MTERGYSMDMCRKCESSAYGLSRSSVRKCSVCRQEFGCSGSDIRVRMLNTAATLFYEDVCPVCAAAVMRTLVQREELGQDKMLCMESGKGAD